MILRFLFLIALLPCPQATEVGENFMLLNNWNNKCLQHKPGSAARGTDCSPSNSHQQWRWLDGLYLQNVGSEQCITSLPNEPFFDMQNCVSGSDDQRLICSFNMITGSQRGQNTKTLGMKGNDVSFIMSGSAGGKRRKWSVYDAVNKKSICNGKAFTDGRKWWMLTNDAHDVSSGLSPLIMFTRSSHSIGMMDSTGRIQNLLGFLDIVNTAPHAVWGINDHNSMWFTAQKALSFGQESVSWDNQFGAGYSFLDFTMPGTGFSIMQDGRFCRRLEVTESVVQGTNWACEASSAIVVEDFSCGVTGCFGLLAGVLHFRQDISTESPLGTGWTSVDGPKHEAFVKIKAGPIYELWGITIDGYPYKRLGMTDSIPIGTAWELVPDVLLKDVSFGIYGPVGIAKYVNEIIILNGSPTSKRQQELDDYCAEKVSQCDPSSVASGCPSKLSSCKARFTPKTLQTHRWRCFTDDGLNLDGNLWLDGEICFYTKHEPLRGIALRYPVFGDFEKQLWMDAFCQRSAASFGCSQPYFSYLNYTTQNFCCRSLVTKTSCPVIEDKHDELFAMTRGTCADNPLVEPFASSQFSTSLNQFYVPVKLSSITEFCHQYPYGTVDVFVEIDFLFRHKICAVGTMGMNGFFIPNYQISYGVKKDSWNTSSVLGYPYVYEVNATTLVKRYLPAQVEARWFRITFQSVKTEKRCLKVEVYGSSLETEADSCSYYKDHLGADLDGVYNIYPKDTEIKKRVFCKGIRSREPVVEYPFEELVGIEEIGCFHDTQSRALPVHFDVSANNAVAQCQAKAHAAGYEVFGIQSPALCFTGPRAHLTYNQYGEAGNCVDGKGGGWSNTVYRIRKADKFFWPLNTTVGGKPAPIKHGKHAVNVLQSSGSYALARFPNHCVTDPELCDDGLSLEFWLWFDYTFDNILTRIIKSGFGKPQVTSRGFTVDLKYHHICMVIHTEWYSYKACVGPLGRPKQWLHVLAFWDVTSGLTVIVDDLQLNSQGIKKRWQHRYFDTNSELRLGDIYYGTAKRYEVAIHSLTIWARKLSNDEVEARFTKGYTMGAEGESCDVYCTAKGLTCDPAMFGKFKNIFSRLGVECASYQPYDPLDKAQPYATVGKTCHGLFEKEKKIPCGASKVAVRRLCRCERPVHGVFTEWSHWSFCSRTCGSGRRVRTRSCTHPSPRFGGKDCEGITSMHDDCQELPCGVRHGILHETWLGNPDFILSTTSQIYKFRNYPDRPSFSHIIENFSMESNRTFYAERFRTYFIAPNDGDYIFRIECPVACSMSFRKRYKVRLLVNIEKGPRVFSSTVTDLVAGEKYFLLLSSVHNDVSNPFKLGFECISSGLNINPITKEYLMWPAQAEQGVSRELWDVSLKGNVYVSRSNTENVVKNEGEADFSEERDNFEIESFGKFYVQRLQGYFLATSNGQYRFYLSCRERCYLYMDDVYQFGDHDTWIDSKWSSGEEFTKTLEGGKFYKIVILHYQRSWTQDYVALGVTLPDGTVLHPISKQYLWLKIPDKLELERQPAQKNVLSSSPVGNALDGVPNTCSMSSSTTNPWLQLESEIIFTVFGVAITNQITNPSMLDNVEVRIGGHKAVHARHRNHLCYAPIAHISSGETRAYPCTSRLSGRFVIIWLPGNNRVLTICEVVVYGRRPQVFKNSYDQGAEDGRVEQWQTSSSEAMPRHDKRNIALHHPYSSWCGSEDDSFWEVRFIERRSIVGVMTGPDPLEHKYVTNARIMVQDENDDWIIVKNQQHDHFGMNQEIRFLDFRKTYHTKSLKFIPLSWFHKPCVRLSIIGKQWDNSFAWPFYNVENTTRMRLSGAESFVKVGGKPGYLIPTTSHIELSGLNILCLWDPKKCSGSFVIGIQISVKDVSVDGVIFSTSGHNTSVVGTSLFLKDSNLVVAIRTATRIWTVTAPASGLDRDNFTYVMIYWQYNNDISLEIDRIPYTAPYKVVPGVPYNGDLFPGVIKLGGTEFIINWFTLDIIPYTTSFNKRIQYAADGWHTEWTSWSYCSRSCGVSGVQYRYRRCTNPFPIFDGLECPLDTLKETRPCPKPSCETNDGVLREVWMNKSPPQFSLSNVFDDYPSNLEVVADFSITYNEGPFAERLRTFLQANKSGEFQIQISCTYQCELWISPNDVPDHKMKILSHDASSNSHWPVRILTGSYNFKADENYYLEVRSFDITGGRNHELLTIKTPGFADPGFSLVRHKPDCYHGLGVESGAIPDGDLYSDATPQYSRFGYRGRLNGASPHCAKRLNDYYFAVDLVQLHWIVAVAVQGYMEGGLQGHVSKLILRTRLDRAENKITDLDTVPKLYEANENTQNIKVINLTEPIRSRYVTIWIDEFYGDGCLRVDVVGCHAGNVAYSKDTEQSTLTDSGKAVDGLFYRFWKYCSNPKQKDNMIWWVVDFGRSYYIGEIFIVGRRDCCQDRMQNLQVRIGHQNGTSSLLNPQCGGLHSVYPARSLSVYCEPYRYGQYLTIARESADSDISLCEVAAFQIENDTVFSNWSDCSVTCGFGYEQRHSICIKPYYCKKEVEVRPCFAGQMCEILMQNCGQLHALGKTRSGTYKVRPNPAIENDIYVYCDHDTDKGGWFVLQRRYSDGGLNMTQSWNMYRDGYGNVSTEFWIGNKYLSELTNHTAYEIMFLFKSTIGSTLKKTKCDAFKILPEEENYRLQLGTCEGPDTEVLRYSNGTEFSTWDKDNGLGLLSCTSRKMTGWWFGNCDSYINEQNLSCFGLVSCKYDVTMMIKPNKVDGGWSHWTMWETCGKPCGGGNSSRVRSCTHPPPTGGGDDCEGAWNETRGCNTNSCPEIELNMTMRFTAETWTADLLIAVSSTFTELVNKIRNNILSIYENDPAISVLVHGFRQGSVIADVSIKYEALDAQQLIVLQEDLDQDGLLNQNMPVVYSHSEIVVTEVLFGPPVITESGNSSSSSIYLKWQPPNSTELHKILGYRIFYKKSNNTSLFMSALAVEKDVFEIEINDLEFYTNYSVRACAFSSSGNGVPTTPHYIMTDEDVPIIAPVIISAYNISCTSMNISWHPVDLPSFRGVPTGYVLHYRIKTSDNTTAFFNATIEDYLETSINISDLMIYKEYEIYMTATTIKGQGKRGDYVYLRTDEDVPQIGPQNLTLENRTSTSLLISWSAIHQEYVNGVLRGYVIEYWPIDDVNDTKNATVGPGKTEVELINLLKFTNYSIKFAGMTWKGIGNWSDTMFQTAEDIPDWGPLDLTALNVSETAINVTWALIPEEYRNGIIIGYRVHFVDFYRHSGNVTVPASQRNIILKDLRSYTMYNISVAGLTKIGEGWKKTSVLTMTNPGAPSREPWELVCSGQTSYTISLHWYRFTPGLTGSLLTGYLISYQAIKPPDPTIYNKTIAGFKYNYIVEGLKGYTNYSFEMYVYNPWGRSKTSKVECRTEEGKPLASPGNLIGISKVAHDKLHLKWDVVPDIQMAGIRRGYTITYKKTREIGELVAEEEKRIDIFDPQKTEMVVTGLEAYSQYSFSVRVFNSKFFGDYSEKIYAETCNCLEDFYMNWCSYMPYVNTSDTGIFPPLIRSAIYDVCGNCSEFGQPKLYFETDLTGSSARKSGLVNVKQNIRNENQINFPLIGRKDSKTFLPMVDSPGSVFVTLKPSLTMTVEYMFIETVIGTFPLLGFAVITASLAGIIMWCLESKKNTKDFPESYSRGTGEGFWWAFISMTTVGYGDRVPITIQGRIFSILWTLYGLVITGMLVGNLTSALTASVAFSVHEVDLYHAKIAAIENTSEFKLGLAKGAIVNKGRNYSDILTVLHAVKVGRVQGALLDMYVVASRPELITKDSPYMVKTVIENPSTYGIELAGHATKLRKPFLAFLQNNAALVSRILEEQTNPVKESEVDVDLSANSGENDINVLAPDSPMIKQPLLYSTIALCVAFVSGFILYFTLCKRRRKALNHVDESAVNPVTSSVELCSALDDLVSKFCSNSKTTLKKIKERHQRELRKMTKLN
ncbi:uncharacterized protein LOC114517441 isoform X2 [Dendronephthya gigantea]|uniref:uncharacterized protein LOC114517441 isoform X2 n=1 Tax=Dendronephthya gigantea TaxID=151771 RepID=UPI00106BDC1A|nr:uncharacterized protein LOC114517441 isoform X2 [Dendronephthya gigantea]